MINSVRLENFKNFRDATLHLGPLTTIVGTNASGKSNLRDAFRFLHGIGRGYSLADIVGEKFLNGTLQWRGIRGGTRELARHGTADFAISVNQTLEQPGSVEVNYHIRTKVGRGSGAFSIVGESLAMGKDVMFKARALDSEALSLTRYDYDLFGSSTVEFELESNDIPALSQIGTRKDQSGMAQIASSLTQEILREMRFVEIYPEAMRAPSFPGQPLGDRGENLSSALLAICEDPAAKNAMMEWIRQLTPVDVVDFEFPSDQVGRVLVALKEANGNVTSAYSASDGTLRFLALIAALLSPDAAQFYFLEEIDNGIHPTRLKLLVELIERQTKKGKIQVVVTTHSPQFVSLLSPESREHAYLVYRHEHEPDAQLKRIMDIPTAKEVLERHSLGRLLETGWLENTMDFATEPAGD